MSTVTRSTGAMKSALREYGLIVVVIAAAMVGYLFYNYNKEAVIDYALDNIGERLVQLLDNESNQEALRQRFAALKSRILDEEVEGAAVEQMAANVLNLSAAGRSITMDEADLLLSEVTEYEAQAEAVAESIGEKAAAAGSTAEATGRAKKEKKVQIELERLGERLAATIKAEEEFSRIAKESPVTAPLPPFVVVSSDNGLHFQVDSMMIEVLAKAKSAEGIHRLDQEKLIVWKKHLAEKRKEGHEQALAELEHVKHHLEQAKAVREMAIKRSGEHVEISLSLAPEIIDKVRVLKELEAKGVWIPAVPDSVHRIVVRSPAAIDVAVEEVGSSG